MDEYWDGTVTMNGDAVSRRKAVERRLADGVPVGETLASLAAGSVVFADGKWELSTYKSGPNKGQACERHADTGKPRAMKGEGGGDKGGEAAASSGTLVGTDEAAKATNGKAETAGPAATALGVLKDAGVKAPGVRTVAALLKDHIGRFNFLGTAATAGVVTNGWMLFTPDAKMLAGLKKAHDEDKPTPARPHDRSTRYLGKEDCLAPLRTMKVGPPVEKIIAVDMAKAGKFLAVKAGDAVAAYNADYVAACCAANPGATLHVEADTSGVILSVKPPPALLLVKNGEKVAVVMAFNDKDIATQARGDKAVAVRTPAPAAPKASADTPSPDSPSPADTAPVGRKPVQAPAAAPTPAATATPAPAAKAREHSGRSKSPAMDALRAAGLKNATDKSIVRLLTVRGLPSLFATAAETGVVTDGRYAFVGSPKMLAAVAAAAPKEAAYARPISGGRVAGVMDTKAGPKVNATITRGINQDANLVVSDGASRSASFPGYAVASVLAAYPDADMHLSAGKPDILVFRKGGKNVGVVMNDDVKPKRSQ